MNDFQNIKSLVRYKSKKIARSQVLEWSKCDNLIVLGVLYKLTNKDYYRIEPELGMKETCDLIMKYLTKCILENPRSSDDVFDGYEAAWTMANWIKHLVAKQPETDDILKMVVSSLGKIYKDSNIEVRDRVLNGTLEHVFEQKDAVSLFNSWKSDPHLKLAYIQALQWGRGYWSQ